MEPTDKILTDQENGTPAQNPTEGGHGTEQPKTVEELMAEIAGLKLEAQRNKTALDKALKGKGEAEKSLRARMTAEEQETEAKRLERERIDEELAGLRKYQQTNEALKRYMIQGMPAELAQKAAEAEITGNFDALASIQKLHSTAVVKAAQEEWMKSRPAPQGGSDDGDDRPDDALSDAEYYQRYFKK